MMNKNILHLLLHFHYFMHTEKHYPLCLEEGLENVFKRHKVCSDALYSGLSAIGLSPFAKEEDRSISIIALNYLDGLRRQNFQRYTS